MSFSNKLYPLLLDAPLHVKVWGGRRLAEVMHKHLPTAEPYGEAWEIHDTSVVINGALAGQTVADVALQFGASLLGADYDPAEGFPLLAKLLDADDWLSVQVHPDDVQAQALEGHPRGKTEAWIILAAEPGAQLVIGVQPGTTQAKLAEAIQNNTLQDHLVYAPVEAGDVLYIPANTIHAIGPGILLYEIQQSCNITYRLYDWGRVGLDGHPRELHIDKGVQVANLETLPQIVRTADEARSLLIQGKYFCTARHQLHGQPLALQTEGRFQMLTCIAGQVTIQSTPSDVHLPQGRSALIPAELAEYTLAGQGTVLRAFQTL
ncbi:MAG: type I phosphomannose isomerase catalytic subunit [Anaerolineales bacterium]